MNHVTRTIWETQEAKKAHTQEKKEFNLLLVGLDISDVVLCWYKYRKKKN